MGISKNTLVKINSVNKNSDPDLGILLFYSARLDIRETN